MRQNAHTAWWRIGRGKRRRGGAPRFVPECLQLEARLYQPNSTGGYVPITEQVGYDNTLTADDLNSTDPKEFWPALYQRAYLQLYPNLAQYADPTKAMAALTGNAVETVNLIQNEF